MENGKCSRIQACAAAFSIFHFSLLMRCCIFHFPFFIPLEGHMPTEIKMPQLGESVTEGTIGKWLKQPGERVEKYEALLEVTTDKVDTEVPAPASGVVRAIEVPEGATVRVGTLLAVLDDEEGDGAQSLERRAQSDQAY